MNLLAFTKHLELIAAPTPMSESELSTFNALFLNVVAVIGVSEDWEDAAPSPGGIVHFT